MKVGTNVKCVTYSDPHLFLTIKNKQLQASSNIAVTEYSVFYLWGGEVFGITEKCFFI
jgi:hypothetical protein